MNGASHDLITPKNMRAALIACVRSTRCIVPKEHGAFITKVAAQCFTVALRHLNFAPGGEISATRRVSIASRKKEAPQSLQGRFRYTFHNVNSHRSEVCDFSFGRYFPGPIALPPPPTLSSCFIIPNDF